MEQRIIIHHNFNSKKFKWLYAKYAYGVNPNHHCTNAVKGKYSARFSRNKPEFMPGIDVVMDEFPEMNWDAIYICGVSTIGYVRHQNYEHNVHIAIIPMAGAKDSWKFENWEMTVENGKFEYVIEQDQLEDKFKKLPEHFVTCRMFRWAVSHYRNQIISMAENEFDKGLYKNR